MLDPTYGEGLRLEAKRQVDYRRVKMPGATYFFTVVTGDRKPLFAGRDNVTLLLSAIDKVRKRHSFEVVAQVILPDHLHAMWELPEGDANYSTRWRLIKEAFTRAHVSRAGAPSRSEK